MLAATSNLIIARLAAWLAIVMLLAQSLAMPSCGCESDHASMRGSCNSATGSVAGSCCSSEGDRSESKAVSPSRASCCESPGQSNSNENTSSCCRREKDSTQLASGKSCQCGTNCRCGMSEEPNSSLPIPAPVDDTRSDRVELAEAFAAVSPVVETHASSPSSEWSVAQIGPATALDRCIMLSRFTC